jgi:hypothetical protein
LREAAVRVGGAGVMGTGIAPLAALAGHRGKLSDLCEEGMAVGDFSRGQSSLRFLRWLWQPRNSNGAKPLDLSATRPTDLSKG